MMASGFSREEIQGRHSLEDHVRDYPHVQGFLELLVPEAAARVGEVPVRHYSLDEWRALPWNGSPVPLACSQCCPDPLIMIEERSSPYTRSYNVSHESLHAAFWFSPELLADYTRCRLLSELRSQPETHKQDYCVLHTLPLFKVFLFGSRSTRTMELLAAHKSEKKWKSVVLADPPEVTWKQISPTELHRFSRQLIDRAIDIAAEEDGLGRRFARVLATIPDAESEELLAYVGDCTWDNWAGWEAEEETEVN